MKKALLILILLTVFFVRTGPAEDTIRVLMHEGPSATLPSGEVESIDQLTGKVLINNQAYTGELSIIKDKNGLFVINTLPLEEYVEGVVASETGKDWEMEALKAQAVISRTYAQYFRTRNLKKDYHLTSSVLHQLYKGKNTDPFITYVVKETEGEILTFGNLPAKAFFHATCEGKTELPEEVWQERYPYLTSVDCNSKNTPYSNWQRKFSLDEVSTALGTGHIQDISIASYTATGRVSTLRVLIESTAGETSKGVRATDLRRLLGYKRLPSTKFSLERKGRSIIFAGQGFGHGVGLSQWGALEMATEGKSYREILAHFYPGTTIKHRDELLSKELASKK